MKTETKTVLKYSFFTPSLSRALKKSVRIHCNVDDDGMIYICNGFFLVKLTAAEYDALIRPVTQRDAGKWVLQENGDTTPDPMDLAQTMKDYAKDAAHGITAAPMLFDASKSKRGPSSASQLTGYYSKSGDFVTVFNSIYAAIVSSALERKSGGSKSPAVVFAGDDPIAIILPVRAEDNSPILRTVRAWFIDDSTEEQPSPGQAAAEVQPQDKAAALVEKLAALPGVSAAVKGAQTAAPVVWLSGDTDAHKDKIEEMGGKWSGKRSAWYFKIA